MVVSTCNRVEAVVTAAKGAEVGDPVTELLARERSVAVATVVEHRYVLRGKAAVHHLFRVASSLDSMMLGEPQILGQLKLAYAQAAEAATVGLVLHRAFHKAFQVAKRVRKATLIGHGSVSVSSVAVSLAGQIFDTLGNKTAMLMGAGKMAELTARHLKALGIESLLITSRTFDRAVALARELGGTAVPFENYKPYLRIADILIGSLSVTKPILTHHEVEAIIRLGPDERECGDFEVSVVQPPLQHQPLVALAPRHPFAVQELQQRHGVFARNASPLLEGPDIEPRRLARR